MNERIRELTDKIWTEEYWDNPNTDKLLPAQLNKFAELIVRECAAYMYTNYPNSRYEVNYMRKHMGDPDWNKSIEVEEHFSIK